MAIVTGITSGQGQEVDTTSKAGRVALYDSAGNEIHAPPVGGYFLPVNLRHTGATALGSTIWAMRNGAARTVFVRALRLALSFDGIATAATTVRYSIKRFFTTTPTGGTTLTAVKRNTAFPPSSIVDARALDTGLSTGALTFETDAIIFGIPVSVTGVRAEFSEDFQKPMERYSPFVLSANEGLCIQLLTASVIGVAIGGFVSWDER